MAKATLRLSKQESIQRILEAAEVCFGRGGYGATSLKQIAVEAGVSKALIHYHFDTKDGLFLEVLGRIHREIARDVTHLAIAASPGIETAMRALDELTRAMLRITPLTPALVELGAVALKDSKLAEQNEAFVFETIQLIEFGILQTLGEAAKGLTVTPPRLARLLHSVVHGIALSAMHGGHIGIREQLDDLKIILLRGLFSEDIDVQGDAS